jgi:hypothetical protein
MREGGKGDVALKAARDLRIGGIMRCEQYVCTAADGMCQVEAMKVTLQESAGTSFEAEPVPGQCQCHVAKVVDSVCG